MVSSHVTAVSAVILFLSTLAQSRNLRMRGQFDDAAAVLKHLHQPPPPAVRPLGAPPMFIQGHEEPGFKPPTQDICDQVADMAKGEMTLDESTCDAVIYGGSAKAPMGCECHFLGEAVKCPWAAPNGGVKKEMIDLGFNRLDNMGKNGGAGSGTFGIQNCMYMGALDMFPHTVEGAKALQKADHDDVLYMVKAIADSTEGTRTFGNGLQWGATVPPWPVDEYGTPNCFGRCTTNPPNVWLRYTTTAPPALLQH